MQVEEREVRADDVEARKRRTALELVFISLLGITVVGALIAALNYNFISARAPLVIIVPLLLLIGFQLNRTRKSAEGHIVIAELSQAIRRKNSEVNAVTAFVAWMVLLLLLIYVAGHYVGISVFMLALLRWVSKESWPISLLVSVGVTVIIFVLFEYGFNIDLYRGYVYRHWQMTG